MIYLGEDFVEIDGLRLDSGRIKFMYYERTIFNEMSTASLLSCGHFCTYNKSSCCKCIPIYIDGTPYLCQVCRA